MAHAGGSETTHIGHEDGEIGLSLERNLANIAGEFPVERSRSDEQASDTTDEFQEPMWLMAGLAERGWTLQKSPNSARKDLTSGTSALATALNDEEKWLSKKWTPQALHALEAEQSHYYRHGSLGSKCDVADELDPVQRGLISEERAEELFEV